MTHHLAALTVLTSVVLGASCRSPQSHFYTLSATATPTTIASSLSIAVGPVSVPAVVNRPEIVVSTGPNEVWPDDFNRWASPLQDNLSRAVAENLVAILGTPRVSLFPQTLSSGADYRVAVEVRRFESTPGKTAILDAFWIVRRKDGNTQTGRTEVTEEVHGNNYDALAAAHSRAVTKLSQDIAQAVGALHVSDLGLPRNTDAIQSSH
jgi:uncharacterized protein